MNKQQILETAKQYHDYVINCRRTIHRFAEISGQEEKTSAFILAEVEVLGLPYERAATHAIIARLETGRPGPHILLRADMDALPVPENEQNLAGPRACRSDNPATCHACGHDAHSAMLLGAMKALCGMKEQLNGTVYFVFEEGEEDGRSVLAILDVLEKYPIETAWAIHVYSELESGKISVDAGPRMAGAMGVYMTVHGRGGHGSRPDLSINPVFAAATILPNLAVAFANQISADETVTLGITSIQGGETANVIPDNATILGSLRFFNMEEGHKALEILKDVSRHTAEMNKCTITFDPLTSMRTVPVINDADCSALATAALNEVLPEGAVSSCPKWYASESVSKYLTKYKGIFAFLGIKNEQAGSGAPHHNDRFDIDENVLETGLIATLTYTLAYLRK